MPRPPDRPDFNKPPLVEVVLSVQFSELRGYRTVHAGLLWERNFRDSFPEVAEKPTLDPVFETFGSTLCQKPRLQLRELPGPPVPRLWFLNREKSHLVQVQADRFLHNWRRTGSSAEYPRYEVLKHKFFEELGVFAEFLKDEGIGAIQPNQCEVTYVNMISLPDDKDDIRVHPEIAFRHFERMPDEAELVTRLPSPENLQFVFRYVIEGAVGEPVGRLHISGQSALDADQRPAVRLDLTARGAPKMANLTSVTDFLDLGRDRIVRAFTAITTSEMHRLWERTQ